MIKHSDNLQTEKGIEESRKEYAVTGERAHIVKRNDIIKITGVTVTRKREDWKAAEKNAVIKRHDNLAVEGEFEKRQKTNYVKGDMIKREDHLQLDGEFTQRQKGRVA